MRKLLMIGHSVIHYFPKQVVGDWHITKWSKSGAITKEGYFFVKEQLTSLTEYEGILVMFGINELYYRMPKEQILEFLTKIMAQLGEAAPQSQLLLAEIMHSWPSNRYNNLDIDKVNNDIQALASKHSASILTWSPLYDVNQLPKKEYSLDGIHLTALGYQWLNNFLLNELK